MYLLNEIDIILALFYLRNEPVKTIRKRIVKLSTRCSPLLQTGALSLVYHSKDPQKAIAEILSPQLIYAEQIKEFYETNHDGFVTVGREIYPLMIEAETDEDLSWVKDNEAELCMVAAHATMNKLELNRIFCRVTLFKLKGYTGVPHAFELQRNGPAVPGQAQYTA